MTASIIRFLALLTLFMTGLLESRTSVADERRDNAAMIRLVSRLAEPLRPSVAQVFCDGEPVAFACVVDSDGYLVTKASELTDDAIRVRLGDNRIYPASVILTRRSNDLTLLKLDVDLPLQPITWTPANPVLGSFVVTVGRRGRAIALGAVGALARRVGHDGKLGIKLNVDGSGRAMVTDVVADSGAEVAGIEPGDIIEAVDGIDQPTRLDVLQSLAGYYPGERVRLSVRRLVRDEQTNNRRIERMDHVATIQDYFQMKESENDRRVNGLRSIRSRGFDSVLQHDTVLQPDDCGSPIIDTSGQVIGLNIARAGRVVSFALPSSLVQREVESMLREAKSRSAN